MKHEPDPPELSSDAIMVGLADAVDLAKLHLRQQIALVEAQIRDKEQERRDYNRLANADFEAGAREMARCRRELDVRRERCYALILQLTSVN